MIKDLLAQGNLCWILSGVILGYLLVIPMLDMGLQRPTYISENALMPDYANGSYEDSFRVRLEKFAQQLQNSHRTQWRKLIQAALGELVTFEPSWEGQDSSSIPLVATVKAERSDGSEALVVLAPTITIEGNENICGMAYLLASIDILQRQNYWARDLLLVFVGFDLTITDPESSSAPDRSIHRDRLASQIESWLADYHFKVGGSAIQGALSLEIETSAYSSSPLADASWGSCSAPYASLEILIEAQHGLLPNLDLVNMVALIDRHRAGKTLLFPSKSIWSRLSSYEFCHASSYCQRLVQLVGMLWRQAWGYPLYSHAPFPAYRIDAITLHTRSLNVSGKLLQDETLDRHFFEKFELTLRSLNNLLEHLHQSFFFYILLSPDYFVSISNYIAIAGLLLIQLCIRMDWDQLGKLSAKIIFGWIALAGINFIGIHFLADRSLALLSFTCICFLLLNQATRRSSTTCGFAGSKLANQIYLSADLLFALTLTACMFLNFGLAVMSAAIYGLVTFVTRRHRQGLRWYCRAPLLLTTPVATWALGGSLIDQAWGRFVGQRLTHWNWGIPFLILQPILLMVISTTSSDAQAATK